MNQGELPPVWRLIFAFGIVFGLISFGLIFVYSWFFVAPFLMVGLAVLLFARKEKARPLDTDGPIDPQRRV